MARSWLLCGKGLAVVCGEVVRLVRVRVNCLVPFLIVVKVIVGWLVWRQLCCVCDWGCV